jgi:hypothetical protein
MKELIMSEINDKFKSITHKVPGFSRNGKTDLKPVHEKDDKSESSGDIVTKSDPEESKIKTILDATGNSLVGLYNNNDTILRVRNTVVGIKNAVTGTAKAVGRTTKSVITGSGSTMKQLTLVTGAALSTLIPAGAAGLGVFFCSSGALNIKDSIKEKKPAKGFRGMMDIDLGVRSSIVAANTSKTLAKTAVVAALNSPAAAVALAGMGILYGAAETGAGYLKAREGIKTDDKRKILSGMMGMGLGIGFAVASVMCPLPVSIALGMLSAARAGVDNRDKIKQIFDKILKKTGLKREKKEIANDTPGKNQPSGNEPGFIIAAGTVQAGKQIPVGNTKEPENVFRNDSL